MPFKFDNPLLKLVQINQKAAEPLADPEDYPNLFEDWQLALGIESKVAEIRFNLLPASPFSSLSCLLYRCILVVFMQRLSFPYQISDR